MVGMVVQTLPQSNNNPSASVINMADFSLLVSTDWLDRHRHDRDVVVLDASVFLGPTPAGRVRGDFLSGYAAFVDEGHIPGAQFADMFELFSDPSSGLPFTRPQREQFERAAGSLGISANSHVVIYDALVGQWASRLWWVFHSFGHASVSVLDGGLHKYVAEGRVLETGSPQPVKPAAYVAAGAARRYAGLAEVQAIVEGRAQGQLVCCLLPADYDGSVVVRSRAGHIPGSVNLPFTSFLDARTHTLLPPQALRSLFESAVDLDGPPIITYCGGGIASTMGSLALALIGYNNTAEFDGSLSEWVLDPARPMRVGS